MLATIEDLLAAGAVQAETLEEICPGADIILLCVGHQRLKQYYFLNRVSLIMPNEVR